MIPGVSLIEILTVSTLMFFIGVYGFLTRKNLITILMSLELMLNGAAINFVAFNKYLYPGQPNGQLFALFLIAVAACEVALAIAIVINLYRKIKAVDVEQVNTLKH
ncbi:MAG: NADH-quinone oxidoreductase subunit NuoK [Saprospiraceae bacterium]|jgi:NADH:ubiquinone oxidoreductase subunit K|nr:NADH-quinone oxidoreductase subunit NuoK [Saprospiraceae bacterium]MBL7793942.1 NADH-quinone oxidoreductase subunit NuoK [Saprospiraceae bacterium]NUQ23351.1 NADH-quinone oxidoreductase subunit NuoK [Saprospiraceae bacterium]